MKNLIALYQVSVNILEHDCKLLLSLRAAEHTSLGSLPGCREGQTEKGMFRKQWEHREGRKQEARIHPGWKKKWQKERLEELLWQQQFLTNYFLLFCLTEELVYFKKYTVVVKQVLIFKAFWCLWGVWLMEKVLANWSQNAFWL